MKKESWMLDLEAIDTLFFRDARPMQAGAGSGGHGFNWPLPTVLHNAVRSALLRNTKGLPGAKHELGHLGKPIASRAFESLRLLGPFPRFEGRVYFPVPMDLVVSADRVSKSEEHEVKKGVLLAPIRSCPGASNWPADWLHPVGAAVRTGKEMPPSWVGEDLMKQILNGISPLQIPMADVHWESEHRIGIGIDPQRRAAAKGLFYSSEHLRLRHGVRLTIKVELGPLSSSAERAAMTQLQNHVITLGGESRMCRTLPAQEADWPLKPPSDQRLIRWILASPAVFAGGWRPNWIDPADGKVCLKNGNTDRLEGEDRKTWRKRIQALPSTIGARLVAICSAKPLAFSGWELTAANGSAAMGGPKPTRLAVPAGSVYYFEAESEDDGNALVAALHGRTRSDFLGEKGMGLGFCGTWQWCDLKFS